jgi:hypothetical protein
VESEELAERRACFKPSVGEFAHEDFARLVQPKLATFATPIA